jgi:8-oxo-dGTP diphosphatase
MTAAPDEREAPGRHVYAWPRPALTVDCVVLGLDADDLKVLLIQRKIPPFQHSWALPGGFVRVDETLDAAARRELEEEAGVAYYALTKLDSHVIRAATDAERVAWFGLDDLPRLAFDHRTIIDRAVERLRGKVRYTPIGFELLPPRFTLTQLQRLYEIILTASLDKRNFRKKLLSMDLLIETDEVEQGVRHRAARLYKFDKKKYEKLARQGFSFDL